MKNRYINCLICNKRSIQNNKIMFICNKCTVKPIEKKSTIASEIKNLTKSDYTELIMVSLVVYLIMILAQLSALLVYREL
jgi:hypothetical protein